MTIDLTTLHGVLEELEACAKGLLYFDHLYARVLDDLAERETTWNSYEADAARAVRLDPEKAAKGLTATEVKGRINEWVEKRPAAMKAREEYKEAERRKEKLERWTRTLEKRIGAAQSAKGVHEQLAEGGGG